MATGGLLRLSLKEEPHGPHIQFPRPGTVLQEWPANVGVTQATAQFGVTRAYLSRILHEQAGIFADMALRLSDFLGTSAEL